MAITTQQSIETPIVSRQDRSIEALQKILAREQLLVSYEEAQELGYELVAFFAAFDAPGREEESDGSNEDIA